MSRRTGRARRPATTKIVVGSGDFRESLATAIHDLRHGLRTRFAPAPTGYLHLGHVANALVTWGVARATGGQVVLRIEDHDRQRCRPEYEAALLDDLKALGFVPDEPTIDALQAGRPSDFRQSDNSVAYEAAARQLDAKGLVYACDCSRSTFAEWAAAHVRPWSGPGCPGGCAGRGLAREALGVTWRVSLGDGDETWMDLVQGAQSGAVAPRGDLPVRDRHGNWTYALCVVVDDLRHSIDLVIRGEDLLDATPAQIRLGALLGRGAPARFLHHPLILRTNGRKLSKADAVTSVRDRLRAGLTPSALRARAGVAIGLPADRRTRSRGNAGG